MACCYKYVINNGQNFYISFVWYKREWQRSFWNFIQAMDSGEGDFILFYLADIHRLCNAIHSINCLRCSCVTRFVVQKQGLHINIKARSDSSHFD